MLFKTETADAGKLLFAYTSEVWNGSYAAQHQGLLGAWEGTGEKVSISGKNKIQDLFWGASDPELLLLSDAVNGDALFLDDLYSAFPDAEKTERIAGIDEIQAGAGDDIVDLNSQHFECGDNGVIVRGGDGNDTIWANQGENKLFGDAGNDRLVGASGSDIIVGGIGSDSMPGGGGNDIFCFCKNWGADTIEQLSDGSVTLWFAEGNQSGWNAYTMTYSDGMNSVMVKGVSADKIILKFGDDNSHQFDVLTDSGAFKDISSEKIFEEKDKAVLACL